jgi:hypothetical protein
MSIRAKVSCNVMAHQHCHCSCAACSKCERRHGSTGPTGPAGPTGPTGPTPHGSTGGLSPEAQRLLTALDRIERDKSYTLSGIYDKEELDFIRSATGRYPVIRGIDMMRYSPAFVRFAGPNADEASAYIADTRQHGFINTASWHWVPSLPGVDQSNYGSAFYKMDFADIESHVNGALRDDVDAIAEPLKQFRDAGIPVIWRPLHEFTPYPWFWWSKDANLFKALWNMMYDRLVHHHGLNNLIWCWNAAHNYNFDASFYPGDDKVHIVSIDYPDDVRAAYRSLKGIANKPVAVAEISWGDWDKYVSAYSDAPYCYICSWSREQGAIRAGADAVTRVYNNAIVRALPWEF